MPSFLVSMLNFRGGTCSKKNVAANQNPTVDGEEKSGSVAPVDMAFWGRVEFHPTIPTPKKMVSESTVGAKFSTVFFGFSAADVGFQGTMESADLGASTKNLTNFQIPKITLNPPDLHQTLPPPS